MTESEFKKLFVDLIVSSKEKMDKNDYKANNKIAKKLFKIIKDNKDKEFFVDVLKELINNSDYNVSVAASIHSLHNNVNKKEAVKNLKKFYKRKDIGIIALGAEYALKEYYNKRCFICRILRK